MISRNLKSKGNEYFQRLVTRVTSMSRMARMRRQLVEIEQRALELPRSYRAQLSDLIARECAQLGRADDAPASRDDDTRTLDTGIERARSDNVQLRMRGIATWLALAHQETRNDPNPESEALHRQVLRLIRQLKAATVQPQARARGA